MAESDELVEEFLVESYENLDQIDVEMVQLEGDHSEALLASIFRNLHTIKGTAGFFDFEGLARVAHAAETLLSTLRAGDLTITRPIVDGLLAAIDAIREMLDNIALTGTEGPDTNERLVERLVALTAGDVRQHQSVGVSSSALASTGSTTTEAPDGGAYAGGEAEAGAAASTGEFFFFDDEPPAEPQVPPPAAPAAEVTVEKRIESSIRVDVAVLDRLMNLVGELVLARNQVLQFRKQTAETSFHHTSQQLDLITAELQEGVMKTRMQPIGRLFTKMPRIVRDLALDCGKNVVVKTTGEETELDRTLLEAIKDPLTHLVRNAVDHGIELPADRGAVGKPEVGTISLRALHEGGQVVIEIQDDGGGLDLDAIREKAIATELISSEASVSMSDRGISQLIFAPGLSTAKKVSNVSGRGVGMDVVRTNIEKIGGNIEILSAHGSGTTITIRIPLTLAIVPALIVDCAEQRYLVSQVNLIEVLHVEPGDDERIEAAGDVFVLRLRDTLLPLVSLRDILGHEPIDVWGSGADVAVLQADGVSFGLVVDQINDTEEIVVKPLRGPLKQIEVYAGSTVMGDGSVALILDTVGIARLGGLFQTRVHFIDKVEHAIDADRRAESIDVLGCRVGATWVGVPVALVRRIEEFFYTDVEHALDQHLIQYRGGVMQLVYLGQELGIPGDCTERDRLPVLVHEHCGRTVGVVVDEIVDVFEVDAATGIATTDPGFRVSGIVGRRDGDLINIAAVLDATVATTGLLGVSEV